MGEQEDKEGEERRQGQAVFDFLGKGNRTGCVLDHSSLGASEVPLKFLTCLQR